MVADMIRAGIAKDTIVAQFENFLTMDIPEDEALSRETLPVEEYFANISTVCDQMSLLSAAKRIGGQAVVDEVIRKEITENSASFMSTIGLKALICAVSEHRTSFTPTVQLGDLLPVNTHNMVTAMLNFHTLDGDTALVAQVRKNIQDKCMTYHWLTVLNILLLSLVKPNIY